MPRCVWLVLVVWRVAGTSLKDELESSYSCYDSAANTNMLVRTSINDPQIHLAARLLRSDA